MKHQPPLNQIKANFPVNPHCQSCGMAAATAAGDLKTISNSFVKWNKSLKNTRKNIDQQARNKVCF